MMEMVRTAEMEIARIAQMEIVRIAKKIGNSSTVNLTVELFPFSLRSMPLFIIVVSWTTDYKHYDLATKAA